ncbi:unnamed protein product [Diabrotica balteata]|uniref:Major facilitator superfamily (MFS) profile domain-containing protein n=1 Tax=Diabrotica balteata TaxID=107213 RepID=A0A9N9TBN3_DIABA|nr:unnamed protein product [Diabrotica balteata]
MNQEEEINNINSKNEAAVGMTVQDEAPKKPDTLFLYFTVLSGTIPLFVGGTSMVWMSPVLPTLLSNDTDLNPLNKPITTVEISLLAALPCLIGLIGCLIIPKFADFIGRKYFLLLMGAGMFITYLGKGFAHHVVLLLIYRCVFTVFLNGVAVILQVYIAEVCEDHNRGKFMYLKSIFYPLGNLYAYAIGPHFNFRDFNLWCGLPIVPFLIFFCLAPETPVYYLSKNKGEDCRKSLMRLRGNKTYKEIEKDYIKIDETLKMTKSITSATLLSLFKTKESLVAVKLTVFLSALGYVSGATSISTFLGPLLTQAGTSYSEGTMTVVVGITQVLSLFLTSFVVERTGRRGLLLISNLGCCLCILIFGLFYYLKSENFGIVTQVQWLPVACIIVYFLIYAIGLGPLPITIITELFPSDLASAALSFAITVMSVVIFIITFLYPIIVENAGVHWCMWIYGISGILGGWIAYKIIPETKGKSIIDIQEMLKQY